VTTVIEALPVHEVELTLLITFAAVIAVIFIFLLSVTTTVIPAVTVPLALLGTAAVRGNEDLHGSELEVYAALRREPVIAGAGSVDPRRAERSAVQDGTFALAMGLAT
jgi:hypothetical protein